MTLLPLCPSLCLSMTLLTLWDRDELSCISRHGFLWGPNYTSHITPGWCYLRQYQEELSRYSLWFWSSFLVPCYIGKLCLGISVLMPKGNQINVSFLYKLRLAFKRGRIMSLMVHVSMPAHRSATARFCFHSVALELRCVLGRGLYTRYWGIPWTLLKGQWETKLHIYIWVLWASPSSWTT